jgi:methyl-accepting chemotaxis protein
LITKTSELTAQAQMASDESHQETQEGSRVVLRMREAMMDIEQSNREIAEINSIIETIRTKADIINDIVFKTQILSFNANIEAARAGPAGRGFAVVATEVGNLADMSGRAAEDVSNLLAQSAERVARIVSTITNKIDTAQRMSQECDKVFQVVNQKSSSVRTIINSISESTQEQSSGVARVVEAMDDLHSIAKACDELSQNLSHYSEHLKSHSQVLVESVEDLNWLVRGKESLPDILEANFLQESENTDNSEDKSVHESA